MKNEFPRLERRKGWKKINERLDAGGSLWQDLLHYSHSILTQALERGNWDGSIYLIWELRERDNFLFSKALSELWGGVKSFKKKLGPVSSPAKTLEQHSSIELSMMKAT